MSKDRQKTVFADDLTQHTIDTASNMSIEVRKYVLAEDNIGLHKYLAERLSKYLEDAETLAPEIEQHDPALYAEMSKPFKSEQAVSDASDKFGRLIGKARRDCRMAEVLVCSHVSYMNAKGEPAATMLLQSFGNPSFREVLAAFALGQAQAERKEMIDSLLAKKPAKIGRR